MSLYNNITQDFYNNINNFGSNPFVLVVLILIILIYYILFAFLGKNNDYESNSSGGIMFIESLLWGLFIILVFINGLSYFYGINIISELRNLFGEEPEIIVENSIDISNIETREVYHIPGNRFSYNDAKAVCKSMDAEMANYEQLREAQKKGASWCSYGWSKDKLGLYPTSQNDFLKLQSKEGHEYDCGLPGINGGYVKNNHVLLGANCYGNKPKKSELDAINLQDELYPKTAKEKIFDERVKFWKNRIGNILLSPFNSDSWYSI